MNQCGDDCKDPFAGKCGTCCPGYTCNSNMCELATTTAPATVEADFDVQTEGTQGKTSTTAAAKTTTTTSKDTATCGTAFSACNYKNSKGMQLPNAQFCKGNPQLTVCYID